LIMEIDHEGADEGRPTRTYAPTEFEVTLTPETIHDMFLDRGEG
jgi:hypothetical protein